MLPLLDQLPYEFHPLSLRLCPVRGVRIAELTGAMLWSAAMVALLTIPAAVVLGIDLKGNPHQLAYVYGLGLVGTWAALISNKLFENRSIDTYSRALIALVTGFIVGAAAIALGWAVQLDLPLQRQYLDNPQKLEPFYFGALYAVSAGWYGLVARNRSAGSGSCLLFGTACWLPCFCPSGHTSVPMASPWPCSS